MALFDSLADTYRRSVPDRIRYPIGHARRSLVDRLVRLRTPAPALPPRQLLQRVQMTPWVGEYLRIGRISAGAIIDAATLPVPSSGEAVPSAGEGSEATSTTALCVDRPHRALDFGCGLGRTLRHMRSTAWQLHGCDVDEEQIAWCRGAMPEVDLKVNAAEPPLPWPAAAFDLCWTVSVFTHFDAEQQEAWVRELARVLRPGGLAIVTTMGPHAFGSFPNLATDERWERLRQQGFVFHRGGETFNSRGAFHTRKGIERIFDPGFELSSWTEGGLDGFQDLSLLRRRTRIND